MNKKDRMQQLVKLYYKFRIPLTSKNSWKRAWRQRREAFLTDKEILKENISNFKKRYKNDGYRKELYKKKYLDFLLCFFLFCCSADEYFQYDFMNKGWRWRNHHITIERRHFIDSMMNEKKELQIIANKARFNDYFSSYIHRKWCDIKSVDETEFIDIFSKTERIIIKPRGMYGGLGIETRTVSDSTLKEVHKKYSHGKPNYVIEEYLNQKGLLHKINPASLNSIRITTLRTKHGVKIIDGFFRCGCGDSIVDNFSSGGIIFPLNVATGELFEGHSAEQLHISVHPLSGIQIKDLKLPDWELIKSDVPKAHELCPESIRLVGWDVVVIDGKVILIEGNSKPGYTTLYDPHNKLWQKVKHSFD